MKHVKYYIKDIFAMRPIRRLKYFISWFPIIWHDEWYDPAYLFDVMRFKLSQMEKGFKESGLHAENEKIAKDLKTCVLLLGRIINDDYYSNVFKWHDKKWGKSLRSNKLTENPFLSEIVFDRVNVKTAKEAKQEKIQAAQLYKLWDYQEKQDIYYLFKIMSKNIRSWWD